MEIFRFMSIEEFEKFNNGEALNNNSKHCGFKTDSIGFCFFDLKEYKPHEIIHSVSGIVSMDICAVFETNQSNLKKSYGVYGVSKNSLDITGDLEFDILNILFNREKFKATEYCTTSYNNKDFKLLKFSENIWSQYKPIKIQKEFKWTEVKNGQR